MQTGGVQRYGKLGALRLWLRCLEPLSRMSRCLELSDVAAKRLRVTSVVALAVCAVLATVSCGQGPSADAGFEETGDSLFGHRHRPGAGHHDSSHETLTPLVVTLPSDLTPRSVAIGAKELLEISDDVQVVGDNSSHAPVASAGKKKTFVGRDSQVGSLTSRSSVRLAGGDGDEFVNVDGNLVTGGSLRGDFVSGQVTTNAAIELDDFKKEVAFPRKPPRGSVTVHHHQHIRLSAEHHPKTRVERGGTLVLASGDHTFESLHFERGALVRLENSTARVQVFVRTRFDYAGSVSEEASGELTANVLWGVLGDSDVNIEAPLLGTLIAPKATVIVHDVQGRHHHHHRGADHARHRGSVYGKHVKVRDGVTLEHRPLPSQLIHSVTVSDTTLCENQPALVTVVASTWSGDALPPSNISINGIKGDHRYVQFKGELGERTISVSATDGGISDYRAVTVTLVECDEVFPSVVVNPSLMEPYGVEFFVQNHREFQSPSTVYEWTFGDGTQKTTVGPYARHSYRSSVTPFDDLLAFDATIRVLREGSPPAIAGKAVSIVSPYARLRKRGIVQPLIEAPSQFQHLGGKLEANLLVQNIEADALLLGERQLQLHFCDPSRDPELLAPEAIDEEVAPQSTASLNVLLNFKDFSAEVCAVGIHLSGLAAGMSTLISAYLDLPEGGTPRGPVTDPETLALLNHVSSTGMTDPNRATEDELRVLHYAQQIQLPPELQQNADAVGMLQQALEEGDLPEIGDVCTPTQGDTEEPDGGEPGLTCQATEEWTVAPPFIRNALKGDLFITSGCGPIGDLLRSVTPRQTYTHEAIMTSNYYDLAHSTFHAGRLEAGVDEVGEILDEDKLRFGWPGTITESVATAFGTNKITDPDGTQRTFRTFNPTLAFCNGDRDTSPPRLIRPPPAGEALIRPLLHAAAERALTLESHYRFFAYTHGNITFPREGNFTGTDVFDSPDGEPPTVSTTFIWAALKEVGIVLEGSDLEPGEAEQVDLPNSGSESGVIEGLYFYTQDEREAASKNLFDAYQEELRSRQDEDFGDVIGPIIDTLGGDQAAQIAAQIANCFATDMCTSECFGPFGTPPCSVPSDYLNPGPGVAVSPEDFLFWDAPSETASGDIVGAYGYEEPLLFRSADYRRVHRWAQSGDAGAFGAQVVLKVEGAPESEWPAVSGALVTIWRRSGGTDANGEVLVPAIPAGQYEARAEKIIGGTNHVAVEVVTIEAGQTGVPPVRLVMEPEGAHPPPGLSATTRIVEFTGDLFVFDEDEALNPNECGTRGIEAECELSPVAIIPQNPDDPVIDREVRVQVANSCIDDEVRAHIGGTCRLGLDNETVEFDDLLGTLFEDSGCGNEVGGTQLIDPFSVAPGERHVVDFFDVRNTVDDDGDFFTTDPDRAQTKSGEDCFHRPIETLFTIRNRAGRDVELPMALPESRRLVTITGDLHVVDNDYPFDHERGDFSINEQCFVDPFSGITSFSSDAACVGGEVRVTVSGTCQPSGDDVTGVIVKLKVDLFEATTCLTDEREDTDQDEVIVLGGASTTRSLRVHNGGSGDFATLSVNFSNAQAP